MTHDREGRLLGDLAPLHELLARSLERLDEAVDRVEGLGQVRSVLEGRVLEVGDRRELEVEDLVRLLQVAEVRLHVVLLEAVLRQDEERAPLAARAEVEVGAADGRLELVAGLLVALGGGVGLGVALGRLPVRLGARPPALPVRGRLVGLLLGRPLERLDDVDLDHEVLGLGVERLDEGRDALLRRDRAEGDRGGAPDLPVLRLLEGLDELVRLVGVLGVAVGRRDDLGDAALSRLERLLELLGGLGLELAREDVGDRGPVVPLLRVLARLRELEEHLELIRVVRIERLERGRPLPRVLRGELVAEGLLPVVGSQRERGEEASGEEGDEREATLQVRLLSRAVGF